MTETRWTDVTDRLGHREGRLPVLGVLRKAWRRVRAPRGRGPWHGPGPMAPRVCCLVGVDVSFAPTDTGHPAGPRGLAGLGGPWGPCGHAIHPLRFGGSGDGHRQWCPGECWRHGESRALQSVKTSIITLSLNRLITKINMWEQF